MNKKQLRKMKAGMVVELSWDDCENTKALLLRTPDIDAKGDVSLQCFHIDTKTVDWHACHDQVVAFHEAVFV